MLDQNGAGQIINAVARRWDEIAKDPANKAFAPLPGRFWMNAAGGRAGAGKWVTVLMYTENDADAEAFRSVLQRWQARGSEGAAGPRPAAGPAAAAAAGAPDLIQIRRGAAAGAPAAGSAPPQDAAQPPADEPVAVVGAQPGR